MKFVLFTHYFSPMNSSGARRPEALVRYLSARGHEIDVFTTKKVGGVEAASPLAGVRVVHSGVIGAEVVDGMPKPNPDQGVAMGGGRYLIFLRRIKQKYLNQSIGQLFDPRLFYYFVIVFHVLCNFCSRGIFFGYISSLKKCDWIIATSPPWPMNLCAVFAAKIFKKKLILDYRDQFSGNHMFSNKFASIESRLDRWMCRNANLIWTVSSPMSDYYLALAEVKPVVVMNGFDPQAIDVEIKGRAAVHAVTIDKKIVRYFGTITSDRLMRPLWNALRRVGHRSRYFFEFYGECRMLSSMLAEEYPEAMDFVQFRGSVSHGDALRLMVDSDALLISESSGFDHASQVGVLTTKLFEYLYVEKPIIAVISSRTLLGSVVHKAGLAALISNDEDEIAEFLEHGGIGSVLPDNFFIDGFSRSRQFDHGFSSVLTADV